MVQNAEEFFRILDQLGFNFDDINLWLPGALDTGESF